MKEKPEITLFNYKPFSLEFLESKTDEDLFNLGAVAEIGTEILKKRGYSEAYIKNEYIKRANPFMLSYMRGTEYNERKLSHSSKVLDCQSGISTAEKVAENYNVSPRTIARDSEFADATNTIAETSPSLKEEILQGEANLTKQEVLEVAKETPEVIQAIAKTPKEDRKLIKQQQIAKRKEEYTNATKQSIEHNKPKIYNQDCVKFMETMDNNSIDLLITDPPYSTDVDDIETFARTWLLPVLEKLKETGRAYICIGAYPKEQLAYLKILLNEQSKFIIDNPLIWTYRNTLGQTPKMKYNLNYQIILHLYSNKSKELDKTITNEMFSVQDINAPDGRLGNRYHTWQKPDELAYRFIKHSTKESDVIFDPFACTGTFLIAASKFNRKAFGCEINKEHIAIAEKRGCYAIS